MRGLRVGQISSFMNSSMRSATIGEERRAARSCGASSPNRTFARTSPAASRAWSGVNTETDPSVMRRLATLRPPPCGRYSTIQLRAPFGVTRQPKPGKTLSYAM